MKKDLWLIAAAAALWYLLNRKAAADIYNDAAARLKREQEAARKLLQIPMPGQ